jgi:hypothetical protein
MIQPDCTIVQKPIASASTFEKLHRALVLLRRRSRRERAEIPPLPGPRIGLPRIETVPAGRQLPNHAPPPGIASGQCGLSRTSRILRSRHLQAPGPVVALYITERREIRIWPWQSAARSCGATRPASARCDLGSRESSARSRAARSAGESLLWARAPARR